MAVRVDIPSQTHFSKIFESNKWNLLNKLTYSCASAFLFLGSSLDFKNFPTHFQLQKQLYLLATGLSLVLQALGNISGLIRAEPEKVMNTSYRICGKPLQEYELCLPLPHLTATLCQLSYKAVAAESNTLLLSLAPAFIQMQKSQWFSCSTRVKLMAGFSGDCSCLHFSNIYFKNPCSQF